jgi:DNA-binding SARP family transcriptional activator
LRKLLNENSDNVKSSDIIVFSQGCYKWNLDADYWLDTDEFEMLCKQGQDWAAREPEKAIKIYSKAIALYKGDYLPECAYDEWALPIRSYYRHIYLQSALELLRLLHNKQRYDAIIKICETVFAIELFEEDFHIYFIDALLALGKIKEARSHYEYITSLFYRELGVKPSLAMKSIYKRLTAENENVKTDLFSIQYQLTEQYVLDRAFFCEPDVFSEFYQLERRRLERSGGSVFLALLTVAAINHKAPNINKATDILLHFILSSLRKGDVVTKWNDTQFLLLLSALNFEQGEKILHRICSDFKQQQPDVVLYATLQPMTPLSPYAETCARHEP